MGQTVEDAVWELHKKFMLEESLKNQAIIKNSRREISGSWTDQIVSKVKISDLAIELNVDKCPECHYNIQFDDFNGWFICIKAKYERACDFKGNIVDFMMRCGR